MADLANVRDAIVALISNAVYPNGTSQPSIANVDIRVFAGWPIPASLDQDLAAGKANVSVFPTNMAHATTRFDTQWQQLQINSPTLTLTVNDISITISGTVSIPQVCMVIVNGTGYAYTVQSNDTLSSIAAGIAAIISGASANGAVVTIPSAYKLIARVTTQGTSIRELSREERVFKISVWATNDNLRSVIANAINVSLSSIERMTLPDGYYARIKYHGQMDFDIIEKARLYRRDLDFSVEYAITETKTAPSITATIDNLSLTPNSL